MTITASVDQEIQLIVRGEQTGSTCSPALADGPWVFDAQLPGYGPGASSEDLIPADSPRQGELPEEYRTARNEQLRVRIAESWCSGTSTSAMKSCSTRISSATSTSWPTPPVQNPRQRRLSSAACTSWQRPPTCCHAPNRR